MYEELIQRLRETSMDFGQADHVSVMLLEAANAIEEEDMAFRHLERDYKDLCRYLPKWIPVTERLPEDGTEVLAFNKTGFAYVDCWTDGKWKINSMVDEEHESVTHWMPLPEPPKEE